ncbi:dienelactone hydrolase family protein [Cupriavidus sp. WKF15]|uniref:dienelactone hydrolase family protein n=1 Tax=Cupriavidus sp. WKF15 TaxID=3032282 RepID=UPI0023E18EBD|nr:dienelactone hydrolase family protein [Cupriavidus sp. WKF15]WER46100.1 dienelactone hydrolase family protein [Cupriavidus sp. WKF15]
MTARPASNCPHCLHRLATRVAGAAGMLLAGTVLAHTPAPPTPALVQPANTAPLTALAPGATTRTAPAVRPATPALRVQLPGEQGAPALNAYWFVPREASTPRTQALPVVIALHGCNGLTASRPEATRVEAGHAGDGDAASALQPRYREYAQWLAERGYAVLMPDSLSAHDRLQGCGDSPEARGLDDRLRRADALAALRWVARQPGIDAARIVLLGWSNGAQAVLATVDASRPWPANTPQVERAVAFYPACKRAVQQHNFRLRAPVLLMIGGADDWTPATRCAMLQSAVLARQPNARFRLEIYPGAYHGFDGTSELQVRRDGPGGSRAGRGVTIGGDAVARVAAMAQLDSWLASPDP